jgi:hypothetical protein
MISRKLMVALLMAGGLAGFFGAPPTAVPGDNVSLVMVLAPVAFRSVLAGRGVECVARGSGGFLTRAASRNAERKPAWQSGEWLIVAGVLAIGIGLGLLCRHLAGDVDLAWQGLGVGGAGCGLIAGELFARKLFGIEKKPPQ